MKAVTPRGTGEFDVEFRSSTGNSGLAHWSGRVELNIDPLTTFPNRMAARSDYLGVKTHSLEELVVALVAHETRHIWQMKNWNACSEFDADAWSLLALKRYRTGDLNISAAIPMQPECDPEADALGDIFAAIVERKFAGAALH